MNLDDESWTWFVLDVNPEPWKVGELSVGRKGNKVYPKMSRDEQLWHYKQAIKEAIGTPYFIEGKMELVFFFWRDRAEYVTPQARTHRKHEADVTNLVKATEDALQGVLFKNDKDTRVLHAEMVEQGPDVNGKVVIGVRAGTTSYVDELPKAIQILISELDNLPDNTWTGVE